MLSLVTALTGEPGVAFPHTQLGSGIVAGQHTRSFHQADLSLGSYAGTRVFFIAFCISNIAQFALVVNPKAAKKGERRSGVKGGL